MTSTMAEYEVKMAELHALLGGRCAVCGTADDLQFDHVDKGTISVYWSRSMDVLLPELAK